MGFCTKLSILVLVISILFGSFLYYQRLPGPNGFGWYSTAEEVISPKANLAGKNVIVTGGYSGIGVPTVEQLAKHKANVCLPTRPSSMSICRRVVEDIRRKTNNDNVFCEEMDLGSLQSVKDFATTWKKDGKPLHILINNAGIMACPYGETVDGHELQFATNHLGHFLLTKLLMDNLKKGAPSRVVTISSLAHHFSGINFDDLKGKNTWYNGTGLASWFGPIVAYGQSKTANILFSNALNKRMSGFGNANSIHPGIIVTNIQRHMNILTNIFQYFDSFLIKTISQGAATQLFVATAPELENVGGRYFNDCNEEIAASWATDPELAEKLWKLSEELTAPFIQ